MQRERKLTQAKVREGFAQEGTEVAAKSPKATRRSPPILQWPPRHSPWHFSCHGHSHAHTNCARAVYVTCTKVVLPDPAIPNTSRHTGPREGCGSAAAADAAIFPLVPPTLLQRRRVAKETSATFGARTRVELNLPEREARRGARASSCPDLAREPTSDNGGEVETLGRGLEGARKREAQGRRVGSEKGKSLVPTGTRWTGS